MKKDNLILFGRIIKPHGVKGEIRVDLKKPFSEDEKLESVFIEIDGKLVPFFIKVISDKGPFAILELEGIESFEQASVMKGNSCYYKSSKKAEPDNTPEFDQLLHFLVKDSIAGNLGEVTAIEEGAQPRLVVTKDGKEILIPFVEELVKSINIMTKEILVDLPEGFLDIYE